MTLYILSLPKGRQLMVRQAHHERAFLQRDHLERAFDPCHNYVLMGYLDVCGRPHSATQSSMSLPVSLQA